MTNELKETIEICIKIIRFTKEVSFYKQCKKEYIVISLISETKDNQIIITKIKQCFNNAAEYSVCEARKKVIIFKTYKTNIMEFDDFIFWEAASILRRGFNLIDTDKMIPGGKNAIYPITNITNFKHTKKNDDL